MLSSTPRPYFTSGKDPVPIVQEAGWAPEPVWTGGKSRPTGIRSPDRPALRFNLYRDCFSEVKRRKHGNLSSLPRVEVKMNGAVILSSYAFSWHVQGKPYLLIF